MGPRTIIPLCFISFFLACNYYILRPLKDTLLITAEGAGAEIIPFVKVWLLLPVSILLAAGFSWITARFSLRTSISTILGFFLCSYFCFTFLMFPFRESIHLHSFADYLEHILPVGWKGFSAVIRYWSYAFFYVMAECWGAMVYSVLFWGFANEVTKMADAERAYPYLTLAGTLAAFVAGPLGVYLSMEPSFPFGNTRWEQSMYALTLLVLVCGLAALVIFMSLPGELFTASKPSNKPKLSLRESITYLTQSRHLMMIALICFSFNMMINTTEVFWKDQLLKRYPDPNDLNSYMNGITVITGLLSSLLTLLVCRPSLKRFGWTFTALITPIVALLTGSLFFGAILYTTFLPLVVLLGSLHICLSFSSKYTLLDPTKELAFIPLESELRLTGKAVIDGVGSRLGKASSSFLFQCLLMIFPSISACAPFLSIFLIFIAFVCIMNIRVLGKTLEPTNLAVD